MFELDDEEKPSFDNSGRGKLRVPGLGYWPPFFEFEYGDRFAHGANGFKQDPRLLAREVAMLGIMNSLTDKLNWHAKVFDDKIVARWREEALQMPLINDKAWDWCLAELRDKAREFETTGRILVLDAASRVCKSTVDETLRKRLKSATESLRDQPGSKKDWHPNSNEQVLNLIHPSLFPLIYGRTPVLLQGGQVTLGDVSSYGAAQVAPVLAREDGEIWRAGGIWSARFQWLPCEVEFDESSPSGIRITSYINNLHPKHKELYALTEEVISLAIESWNEVLVKKYERNPPRIKTYGAEFEPQYPEWANNLWDIENNKRENPEAYNQILPKVLEYLSLPNSSDFDSEEEDEEEDDENAEDEHGLRYGLGSSVDRKWNRLKTVIHPDAGAAYTYDQWKKGQVSNSVVQPSYIMAGHSSEPIDPNEISHRYYDVDLRSDFKDKGLQVIVKLSSIELTPEKPAYGGGNWHIEGFQNEHIVATAIYYYDVDNVTEPRISFRTEAVLDDMEISYAQDDHKPLAKIFGVDSGRLRDEPALQNLGSVSTPQGRLLAFPNTLQHKVEPFELADKTKPGHRRFLVVWLVDPHYRICSTRNVPPQQHDWWAPEVYDKVDFSAFPPEILKMVADQVGEWPMGLDEAKQHRLELMAERTRAEETSAQVDEYNFCEH